MKQFLEYCSLPLVYVEKQGYNNLSFILGDEILNSYCQRTFNML